MRYLRTVRFGEYAKRLMQTGHGLGWACVLLLGAPASAQSPDGTPPLPPPGAYFSASVLDSATGLPLADAALYIRNPQAYYSVARTDTGGWAHVPRDRLPYGMGSSIQALWVTATSPGYVSRMITCGPTDTASRVLLFSLPRATAKNSINFTGTLIDSATQLPLPRVTLDLSHGVNGGWMTHVAVTDDAGQFAFGGIPIGYATGTFWVRKPNGSESYFPVSLSQGGKPIIVSGFNPTALAAPRVRQRAAALYPFPFREWDAAGRRRHP